MNAKPVPIKLSEADWRLLVKYLWCEKRVPDRIFDISWQIQGQLPDASPEAGSIPPLSLS